MSCYRRRPRSLEITATVAFSEIKKDVLQLFMGV
ncbi:hypothetical protein QO008_000663 [Peptoniphilus ivorii]|nr:hypothetical protein [Peptoniphilus ivorii]